MKAQGVKRAWRAQGQEASGTELFLDTPPPAASAALPSRPNTHPHPPTHTHTHTSHTQDRLDTVSHAATATGAASIAASSRGGAAPSEALGPPISGPPASALQAYREAVKAVAEAGLTQPPTAAAASDIAGANSSGAEGGAAEGGEAAGPKEGEAKQKEPKAAGGDGAAGWGCLAVVLDPSAAVLTSPWCLYGIWLYLKQRTATRLAAAAAQPPPAGGAEGTPGPSAAVAAMAAAGDVVPVCAAGLDALLVQLVWENLSLLQGSPHTGDALHATLLEDVAMQEPVPALPQAPPPAAATGQGGQGGQRPSTSSGGGPSASGGVTPARSANKDASFAGGAGNPPSGEPDIEERMADADAAVKAAVLVSLEKRVRDLEAAAEPSGGSAAAPPVVHALAAANDASGCLAWAAGRPADGEPLLRRARELRMHALGPTGAAPLLAAHSTMHLGALLHILHFRSADEAELLLRSAVELLDAVDGDGETAAAAAGGYTAAVAPPLLAAQARHFLAQLLSLRAAAHAYAAPSLRNATGLHHLPSRNARTVAAGVAASAFAAPAPGGASGAAPAPTAPGAPLAVTSSLPADTAPPLEADTRAAATAHAYTTASSGGAAPAAASYPILSGGASMQLPPGNAPAEVAPLLRAALPVFESHYGAEHPLTATLHSNLALALKDHGRLEEAEPLLRRALAVREAVHGPTHLDTMRTMNNLAGLVEAKVCV